MKVRICNEEGCNKKHRRNGLCDTHHTQMKRTGRTWPIRKKGVSESKTCRQCRECKARTEFRSNGRNAVKPICRECERENYKENREALNAPVSASPSSTEGITQDSRESQGDGH